MFKASAIVISRHNAETKSLNTVTYVAMIFGKSLITIGFFHLALSKEQG